jgi:thioredoxin reductase (NADPH)
MLEVDLAVIGAGVAGLSAARVAAAAGLQVLVLERMACGGQVMNVEHINNFARFPQGISGFELGPVLQEECEEAGVQFLLAEVEGVSAQVQVAQADGTAPHNGPPRHLLHCSDETVAARTVIVAAGSARRKLGVPGEDELEGRGVSHCASCDGPLVRGLDVVVVGGGDSAISEALVLAGHAHQVTVVFPLLTPHSEDALTRAASGQARIKLLPQAQVTKIVGSPGPSGQPEVRGVQLRSQGMDQLLPAQAVFVYAGLQANTAFLGRQMALDAAGRIQTDDDRQTSVPGIFAAGDIRAGCDWRLDAAAADGEVAAHAVVRTLQQGEMS